MIHTGKFGSISFFYKDKLIASSPLTKNKTLDLHYEEAGMLIVDGMKKGLSIEKIKTLFLNNLIILCNRKKYKITREDEKYIVMCFMILIKLKFYEFDDVALIMGRKK